MYRSKTDNFSSRNTTRGGQVQHLHLPSQRLWLQAWTMDVIECSPHSWKFCPAILPSHSITLSVLIKTKNNEEANNLPLPRCFTTAYSQQCYITVQNNSFFLLSERHISADEYLSDHNHRNVTDWHVIFRRHKPPQYIILFFLITVSNLLSDNSNCLVSFKLNRYVQIRALLIAEPCCPNIIN